jgi:hypothetical protein
MFSFKIRLLSFILQINQTWYEINQYSLQMAVQKLRKLKTRKPIPPTPFMQSIESVYGRFVCL